MSHPVARAARSLLLAWCVCGLGSSSAWAQSTGDEFVIGRIGNCRELVIQSETTVVSVDARNLPASACTELSEKLPVMPNRDEIDRLRRSYTELYGNPTEDQAALRQIIAAGGTASGMLDMLPRIAQQCDASRADRSWVRTFFETVGSTLGSVVLHAEEGKIPTSTLLKAVRPVVRATVLRGPAGDVVGIKDSGQGAALVEIEQVVKCGGLAANRMRWTWVVVQESDGGWKIFHAQNVSLPLRASGSQ